MGAKQSKRSVDISGKEAEGGGEVAAAGAGGEGRVEQIADVDALKTQLNGDAHIQHEQTDKEKELDSGTPENEKDATTEKEEKEGSEKEKEASPVTNGDAEEKIENGESTPTAEDGKKPKKEKVKKKWSLRSISFSRKDKPKQEKKQKDEEPKTNGEPEKVPEETAEAAPESATNEVAEEAKAVAKEETTPETPVTEPLTNGTSTPESAKADTPASEEAVPAPVAAPEAPKPEPKPEPEPEQLPVNGLSLEEPKSESAEVEKIDETKPEAPAADIVETAPAPEIPVKEVCVEQMPLLEPTPPPLPANPPPSSVASFAATTMAPELGDAALPHADSHAAATLAALSHHAPTLTDDTVTDVVPNDISSTFKTSEAEPEPPSPSDIESTPKESDDVVIESEVVSVLNNVESESAVIEEANKSPPEQIDVVESKPEPIAAPKEEKKETIQNEEPQKSEPESAPAQEIVESSPSPVPEIIHTKPEPIESSQEIVETKPEQIEPVETKTEPENVDVTHETELKPEEIAAPIDIVDPTAELIDLPPPSPESPPASDSPLPPPPAHDDDIDDIKDIEPVPEHIPQEEEIVQSNHVGEVVNGVNGISLEDSESDKIKTKATCNGGEATPEAHHTQELMVSDKLADLIPEVPDVPELKTETLQESSTDVAVAN